MKYKVSKRDSFLIKKLIAKYSNVIQIVKNTKDLSLIEYYLINEEIKFGVCCLSHQKYNTTICNKTWISYFCKKGWWGKVPNDYKSKAGKIKALQLRLDILTKILKNYEKKIQKEKKLKLSSN